MKGLIDHYIISLDKVEKELREKSNEKSNYKEESDEDLDFAIAQIFEEY